MFKLLRQNRGQGAMIQYSLMVFLVTALVFAMATFVKRSVQGRIYDARHFMFDLANAAYSEPNANLYGNLALSYEPYYINKTFQRVVDTSETEKMLSVPGTSGIYEKDYNDSSTELRGVSHQAPVHEAK